MCKKVVSACVLVLFFLSSHAFAHKLLVGVMDNGDDTITVQGKFDTGASAEGALVRLEALGSGAVLFRQRLPLESEITVKIPMEPYRIVLDGGPGHITVKEGIVPRKGFTEKVAEKNTVSRPKANRTNLPFILSTGMAFFLLLLTLFVSIRNTNKILNAISRESVR